MNLLIVVAIYLLAALAFLIFGWRGHRFVLTNDKGNFGTPLAWTGGSRNPPVILRVLLPGLIFWTWLIVACILVAGVVSLAFEAMNFGSKKKY